MLAPNLKKIPLNKNNTEKNYKVIRHTSYGRWCHDIGMEQINTNMIAYISNLLNLPTTDWSDIDRLEQRICDLRRRIREAKSTQERFFSTQRIHDKKPFNLFPDKSNDAKTGMGKRSTVS